MRTFSALRFTSIRLHQVQHRGRSAPLRNAMDRIAPAAPACLGQVGAKNINEINVPQLPRLPRRQMSMTKARAPCTDGRCCGHGANSTGRVVTALTSSRGPASSVIGPGAPYSDAESHPVTTARAGGRAFALLPRFRRPVPAPPGAGGGGRSKSLTLTFPRTAS